MTNMIIAPAIAVRESLTGWRAGDGQLENQEMGQKSASTIIPAVALVCATVLLLQGIPFGQGLALLALYMWYTLEKSEAASLAFLKRDILTPIHS